MDGKCQSLNSCMEPGIEPRITCSTTNDYATTNALNYVNRQQRFTKFYCLNLLMLSLALIIRIQTLLKTWHNIILSKTTGKRRLRFSINSQMKLDLPDCMINEPLHSLLLFIIQ